MQGWTTGRLGAIAGIGFIVLTAIGDALAGSMPSTGDSGAKIASFFDDHHQAVVAGAVLTGIAAPLFLAFASALALRLRAAGPGLAPALFFGSALVGVSLGIVADALYGSLARIGLQGDASLAKGVYVADGFVTAKSFWFATAAILAAAWGSRRLLAQWYGVLSLAAGIVVAVGGIALRSKGFFAPLGDMSGLAFLGLLVWVVATCVVLWREPTMAEVPAA
jgi:hypothetical protein